MVHAATAKLFSDIEIEVISGQCPEDAGTLLNILKGVEEYGIFAVQA